MRWENFLRRWLCSSLLCLALPLSAQTTLAVLNFDNNSIAERARLQPLCNGLSQMFTSALSQVQQLRLVERTQLTRLIDEMKLTQAGVIDGPTAQQVGKLLGAQQVLLGSFVYLPNKKLRLDARLVQVETGLTLRAGEETGKEGELFEMVARLNKKLLRELAVRVTAAELARLDAARNVSFAAALLYAEGVALEDRKDFQAARKKYEAALAVDKSFALARQRLLELEKISQ
ncbi:MAG: CsgG/HfaB family protein [candidate division KSB1 bacterium]